MGRKWVRGVGMMWTRKAKALFVKHSSDRTGIYLIYMLIQFYLYVTDRGGRSTEALSEVW